jgi:protoporphyrinogen IX oxidase
MALPGLLQCLRLFVLFNGEWDQVLFEPAGKWLLLKLIFVVFLYGYHFSLQHIFSQQIKGIFRYSSNQLRLWNEVATIFLFAIVMLVVVKESMSLVYGLGGMVILVILLMAAIKIYKRIREKGE